MNRTVGHIDIDLPVDLDVLGGNGDGVRAVYAVSCRVPVLEGMKPVCRAALGSGVEAVWLGRDGVPMRSFEAICTKRKGRPVELPRIENAVDLASWTARLSGRDLIRRLPDRHGTTGERALDSVNVLGRPWEWVDGGSPDGFDLSPALPRVDVFRRNAEARLAIQDGHLFLARQLPTWHPDSRADSFSLVASDVPFAISEWSGGVGSHYLVNTFSADRTDAVREFQRIRGTYQGPLQGQLLEIDPAYGPPSDLPDAAMAICSWIVMMAKIQPAQLDSDVVRHWHQLSNWALNNRYDVEAAREALVSARTYVDAVKDLPEAFRGRERTVVTEAFYRNCLARMDVEGIRTVAHRDGAAPRAA